MHQNHFLSAALVIALRVAVAILAATAGGLFALAARQVSHRLLCGLVSLAAGALLGVALVHILPETVGILGIRWATLSVVLGFSVFALVGRYVYFMCPACTASASEHETGFLRLGALLVISMSIHSIVDGMAISAGYACGAEAIGVLILTAVAYHKVPEGLALVSLGRLAGYGRGKALLIAVLVELTTALGACIGLLLLSGIHETLIGATLGFVAGTFLYTVGFALLKEMFVHEKGSIIIYALIGFAMIVGIGRLLEGVHWH